MNPQTRTRTLLASLIATACWAASPAQAVQTVYAGTTWNVTTSTINYYVNSYGTTNSSGTLLVAGDEIRCVVFIDCASIDNQAGAVWNNSAFLELKAGAFTTWGTTFITGGLTNRGTFNNNNVLWGGGTIANSGTMNNYNNAEIRVRAGFNNQGTLNNFKDGLIGNQDLFTSTGTINNQAGAYFSNTMIVRIDSGTFNNAGTLQNDAQFGNKGTLQNTGTLTNKDVLSNYGSLQNSGSLTSSGTLANNAGGTLTNTSSGTITNTGTATFAAGSVTNNAGTFSNAGSLDTYGSLNNSGTLTNQNVFKNSGTLTNTGTLNNTGTLTNNTDSWITNKSSLRNSGALTNNWVLENQSGASLATTGSLINSATGTFSSAGAVSNAGTFSNAGWVVGAGTYTQSAGRTINNGSMTQASFQFTGGAISGSGSFTGAMNIGKGVQVAPGNSPGTLTINGDLASSGDYSFEIAGTAAGQYDVLAVNGNASFTGGTMTFAFLAGYTPSIGSIWSVLRANSISGWNTLSFNVTGLASNLDWQVVQNGGNLNITVLNAVPEPAHWLMLLAGLGLVLGRRRGLRPAH